MNAYTIVGHSYRLLVGDPHHCLVVEVPPEVGSTRLMGTVTAHLLPGQQKPCGCSQIRRRYFAATLHDLFSEILSAHCVRLAAARQPETRSKRSYGKKHLSLVHSRS